VMQLALFGPVGAPSPSPQRVRRSEHDLNAVWPAICSACGKCIDLEAAQTALSNGNELKHTCGRILVRQRVV
jgi:hypothetical protein